MFDRVVMNVLGMPHEIDRVADLMFPEAPLPQQGAVVGRCISN